MVPSGELLLAAVFAAAFPSPPQAPGPESWTFREELARADDAGSKATPPRESRTPWLRHRISRCYFSPIKRPPFNRDELLDDIDYYPDAYLARLADEKVNGLWLSVELDDLVETSFNRRAADAAKRLEKLRRTVEKCNRYGVSIWPFCIEPHFRKADDPMVVAHPGMFSVPSEFPDYRLLCPSTEEGRRYLEEAAEDLFRQVPGLPGILNLSHGERPTTCLSAVSPLLDRPAECPRCRGLRPGEIHALTAAAFLKGMRRVNPQAEFLSWFYQPHVVCGRANWVVEVPRYLPEGVTMLYNFESGAVKEQLGRYRAGGDYWLSYVGPSPAFSRVADSARGAGASFGAKIQVGCSHECATLPFVPAPGLLYRKFRAMKAAGCSAVMMCWYFGNYPGVMNEAAGELAHSDFSEDEDTFLRRLAARDWGGNADRVAALWRRIADAYSEYPLSNDMQYYGPFHAGIAWPLHAEIDMKPLARTWKPHDPPSGDAIGECLENHSLEEASVLAGRMRDGVGRIGAEIAALKKACAGDLPRLRDLGVMKAMCLLFASGADIFDFYLNRARAVKASRIDGDSAGALAALASMRAIVLEERRLTAEMLPLARADSRLGFHSEAEVHQFFPAKLEWRLGCLERTLADIDRIRDVIAAGGRYPESEHERTAAAMKRGKWTEVAREFRPRTFMDSQLDMHVDGEWVPTEKRFRFRYDFNERGDFVLEGTVPDGEGIELLTMDACGTSWARAVKLKADGGFEIPSFNVVTRAHEVRTCETAAEGDGWRFRLVLDARGWDGDRAKRPGWIYLRRGEERPIWPEVKPNEEYRLNIGNVTPDIYGRLEE